MKQSNVIFGAVLLAFLIFITARGELGQYLALLLGPAPASSATTGTGLSNVTITPLSGSGGTLAGSGSTVTDSGTSLSAGTGGLSFPMFGA